MTENDPTFSARQARKQWEDRRARRWFLAEQTSNPETQSTREVDQIEITPGVTGDHDEDPTT